MLERTWSLLRARLAMAGRSGWPVPSVVFLAALSTALALLVRDLLAPFPYALCALSFGALLLVVPLLSDLGAILRHDEGEEWVAALPARAMERTLARTLHLLTLLGVLILAWYVPWAVLAPSGFTPVDRVLLPGLGFSLALFIASVVLWAQQLLLARMSSLLVALQTSWVALVVFLLAQLLGGLARLAQVTPEQNGIGLFPPTWFALPIVRGGLAWAVPGGLALACVVALIVLPQGKASRPVRQGVVERVLEPLRRIAVRFWVRKDELGPFDLVYRALPREREVALRTIPLAGIPLAFLWISARGESEDWRADILALLLFTVGIYLPLLLTHVSLSESSRAAWILRTAPIPASALVGGGIKAIFVRWVLPLYLALLGLGMALSQWGLLLRLWLPALLLALVLLQLLYERCVLDLPLSTPPEELRSDVDWAGLVLPLAIGLTLLAVVANRRMGIEGGVGMALALVLLTSYLGKKGRRSGS